jgi:hypothetical protein
LVPSGIEAHLVHCVPARQHRTDGQTEDELRIRAANVYSVLASRSNPRAYPSTNVGADLGVRHARRLADAFIPP